MRKFHKDQWVLLFQSAFLAAPLIAYQTPICDNYPQPEEPIASHATEKSGLYVGRSPGIVTLFGHINESVLVNALLKSQPATQTLFPSIKAAPSPRFVDKMSGETIHGRTDQGNQLCNTTRSNKDDEGFVLEKSKGTKKTSYKEHIWIGPSPNAPDFLTNVNEKGSYIQLGDPKFVEKVVSILAAVCSILVIVFIVPFVLKLSKFTIIFLTALLKRKVAKSIIKILGNVANIADPKIADFLDTKIDMVYNTTRQCFHTLLFKVSNFASQTIVNIESIVLEQIGSLKTDILKTIRDGEAIRQQHMEETFGDMLKFLSEVEYKSASLQKAVPFQVIADENTISEIEHYEGLEYRIAYSSINSKISHIEDRLDKLTKKAQDKQKISVILEQILSNNSGIDTIMKLLESKIDTARVRLPGDISQSIRRGADMLSNSSVLSFQMSETVQEKPEEEEVGRDDILVNGC